MKKIGHVFLWVLMVVPFCSGQVIFKKPLSQRVVHYTMDVRLVDSIKTVNGRQTLIWKNVTSTGTDTLYFHLYLNAFRDWKTTFMNESKGRHRGATFDPIHNGRIDVDSLVIDGMDFSDKMQFAWPDDGNKKDSTVMYVVLPRQVKPGQSIEIKTKFRSKLPKVFARTGFYRDFYMVGQWFPKIAVLEEKGWNCHQFHLNSEFFADFGVYDVHITVPSRYKVGACGVRVDSVAGDSTTTYTYRGEDIHDFSWTASPDYVKMTRTIRGVEVELLSQPEHVNQAERYFESMDVALKYFGEWYMPYPYPKVTVVDPPLFAMGAGGMEYPTLITGGSVWNLPDGIYVIPEMVTIHEFGHQYFYGIMASNEFEEAWLDEGMNSYSETRARVARWGEWTSMMNWGFMKMGDYVQNHSMYQLLQRRGVVNQFSWTYPPGGYGFNSYQKPTLLLTTLQKYLGDSLMQKVWNEYFNRFAFKHPTTTDFIATVNDVTGRDMSWFFDQFVNGDAVVDYKVLRVRSHKYLKKDTLTGNRYKNTIWLARNSDGMFPVEARVITAAGDTTFYNWNGVKTAYKIEFESPSQVVAVDIDPERKNYLDINWTNNSWRKNPHHAWLFAMTSRYLFMIQQMLISFTN